MRKSLVASIVGLALLGACAEPASTGNEQQAAAGETALSSGIDSFKAGNYPEAEASFQKVLADDPTDPYANLNMGVLKAIQGDEDSAVAFYLAAIENGKDSPIVQVVNANGQQVSSESTVAAVAQNNIERLDL